MLTIAALTGVLVAAVGVGYTASRPLLGDGSAHLAKGHTVAHVNGETGQADAEVALQLATGKEELQPVRLPDGRLVVVNRTTGTVSYLDSATMTATAAPMVRPTSAGRIEPVATAADGYLVDRERNTVERIIVPGQPAAEPVRIPEGITAAVPSGDSVWVSTAEGEVVEVNAGQLVRTIRLGAPPVGITVADSHPVAVTEDGTAYVLDADQPRAIGNIGLSGRTLALGAWRGAGRHVLAVDRGTAQVSALDPRTGHRITLTLKLPRGRPELAAPVTLGGWAYVPDYAGPSLWRINLTSGAADARPLEVPGQPGAFALIVSGGRVWANSQYDRRALVVDADGHSHYADKGPGAELGDTEGDSGPPAGGGTPTGNQPPDPPDGSAPDGPPAEDTGRRVTVPLISRGTPYRDACSTITAARLVCRAVASGDAAGLRTGDVLGTDPPGGRQVPEGSRVIVRYVGPQRTPSVVGVTFQEACRRIRAAKLTCTTNIDPNPALAPDQLGVVSRQDPQPRASIAKGDTVTITYADSIALPSVIDQMFDAACDRLEDVYKMDCQAAAGDPPPAGKNPGQVYAQDPPSPTLARIGATVSIRYYRGESTLDNVIGQNIFAACGAIQASGLQCTPVEGATAWGTGHAVAEVYAQSPAGGATLPVGSNVTLTFYSGNNDLPNYGGGNAQAACADINARGFQCNAVANTYPSTNVVVGQDQPAGRYPLGSAITIHYSPFGMVDWWIVPFGGGWRMNAGSGTYRVGAGYAAGTPIPGARNVNQYICSAGGGRCRGYNQNVFYSLLPPGHPNIDPDFTASPGLVLMSCTGQAGQRKVWRTWNAGSPRAYGIVVVDAQPVAPPAGDSELLGCIW